MDYKSEMFVLDVGTRHVNSNSSDIVEIYLYIAVAVA